MLSEVVWVEEVAGEEAESLPEAVLPGPASEDVDSGSVASFISMSLLVSLLVSLLLLSAAGGSTGAGVEVEAGAGAGAGVVVVLVASFFGRRLCTV